MKDSLHAQETELLVCVTCRRKGAPPEDERRPGRVLFDAILAQDVPEGLRVTPVECLQNCSQSCTVALRGGDEKWTYVFSNVDETEHAGMILSGAAQYHAAPDGVIPWRERPEHFKRNCLARIPPIRPASPKES
ncbi:hypothetical protein RA2_04105 [Roseovarius sp. A-2]|jgi:predicted metal-binding protein|uniref:DUF1636 family protein n=1 Tax=Roseovarius sp. A-2 TaxID=1570360 RepID=UPI0009B52650|nr:DUF1636 domain-containing protein [Roseovarius sp. A-2]MAM40567.1 DUF1636 domain-containing protein [Erythrobacter sp.]GAW37030.1 hypothetical protein RA2_04105 [Roseovarius sp. A-2]